MGGAGVGGTRRAAVLERRPVLEDWLARRMESSVGRATGDRSERCHVCRSCDWWAQRGEGRLLVMGLVGATRGVSSAGHGTKRQVSRQLVLRLVGVGRRRRIQGGVRWRKEDGR